ncbi:protein disulfide isomerase MPD1 PWA37_001666 [Arxiozyma heterogenica]|uniref:protein disulfide isomerase MPD1 n=1 Tax=Arxiozyma heterogenica TaxID=278026 RepID=UPI002F0CAC88
MFEWYIQVAPIYIANTSSRIFSRTVPLSIYLSVYLDLHVHYCDKMRPIFLTFFCWLTILNSVFSINSSPSNFYNDDINIIEATTKSFDKIIYRSNYTTLVEFYAPWCGHCRNLMPTMKKVAKKLSGLVQVVTVNCDLESNKPLCAEYRIEGFPTLKVFKPQKVNFWNTKDDKTKKQKPRLKKHIFDNFMGERKVSAIVDYCLSRIKNYVKKLETLENAYKLKNLPYNRTPMIIFNKNDRVSPMLKSMAIDWLDHIQFFSIYNKKISLLSKDTRFYTEYPNIVQQLNKLIESIKDVPNQSRMIILDFDNDTIIEYDENKVINKENLVEFLFEQFQIKPREGPFSDRENYLNVLKKGSTKKNKKVKRNSNQKPKKNKDSNIHDEL